MTRSNSGDSEIKERSFDHEGQTYKAVFTVTMRTPRMLGSLSGTIQSNDGTVLGSFNLETASKDVKGDQIPSSVYLSPYKDIDPDTFKTLASQMMAKVFESYDKIWDFSTMIDQYEFPDGPQDGDIISMPPRLGSRGPETLRHTGTEG